MQGTNRTLFPLLLLPENGLGMEGGQGERSPETSLPAGGSQKILGWEVQVKAKMIEPEERARAYKTLAANILEQAVSDWKHFLFLDSRTGSKVNYFKSKDRWKIYRTDLETFLRNSPIFALCCDTVGEDPDVIREGIYKISVEGGMGRNISVEPGQQEPKKPQNHKI